MTDNRFSRHQVASVSNQFIHEFKNIFKIVHQLQLIRIFNSPALFFHLAIYPLQAEILCRVFFQGQMFRPDFLEGQIFSLNSEQRCWAVNLIQNSWPKLLDRPFWLHFHAQNESFSILRNTAKSKHYSKFFNQKCFDSDKRMRYCAYTKSLAWALRRFNHGSPSGILHN